MALTVVQSSSDFGGPDKNPHQSWKPISGGAAGNPTPGNLLLCLVTWNQNTGSATCTMPAGWVTAADVSVSNTVHQMLFYKTATDPEATKVTPKLSASRYWAISLCEVHSTASSGWLLDQFTTKTGSDTAPATGTTLATSAAEEFWAAGISAQGKATLSAPTNGFAIETQENSGEGSDHVSHVLLDKIVAATDFAFTAGTYDTSVNWVGLVAAFKSAPKTVTAEGAVLSGGGSMYAFASYATPTLVVQAAFGHGSSDPDPVWTNITDYCRTCSWQRGRQNELNQVQAGTATVVLNDRYSAFDPNQTDSPFYPYVKPGLPVRGLLFVGGNFYPLFYGFAERLPRTERVTDVYTQRQIDLTDGFALLAVAGLGGYSYGETTSDERVHAVANSIGWPEKNRMVGPGASILQEISFPAEDDTRAQTHYQQVSDSENGLLFVDGSNNLVFVGRHTLLTDEEYTLPKAAFTDGVVPEPVVDAGWGAGGWGAGGWGV